MARSLFPLQSFHVHGELTPVVWEDGKMKPEVRKRLLEIAKTFEESLGIPVKVKDIWLTGSTANYNWSEFSDIDLHLLLDFADIDEDEDMVRELMLAKKSVFNEEHDIKIGPFEVELYAQDINEPHEATGVYSVKNDRWLRRPKREKPELDLVAVKRKAASMMRLIDEALAKDTCDSACLDRAMERVKKMRKSGLDKGGEYSVENLAFKVLRRNGYLEKLWTEQRKRLDRELSLPEKVAMMWLRQAKYNPEFLQWVGQQRFVQPDTKNRVLFQSLPDQEQKKIYDRWKQMAHGEGAERMKEENRWLRPNPDPKRYDHVKFQIRLDEETAEADQERLQQMFDTEDQDEIRNAILDLAGVGGVASMVESVDVLTWQEGEHEAKVKVLGRGKDGIHFDRTLTYEATGDEDQPYVPDRIQNELFSVGRQAPPGAGTRMLASQVGAAEDAGFRLIEAEAGRSETMNGYYTWPRLGFNAELTQEDLDDLEEENPEAAWQVRELAEADADRMWPNAPAELFHVMAIPEARTWWEREGHSVMAAFSVSDAYDGGKAYQLLRAYTEAKAMAEGKTIPEYLAKIAGKNMPPRLTEQDNQILDRVWDQARKRILANVKNKKKASELARFWIWTKIVKNTLPI